MKGIIYYEWGYPDSNPKPPEPFKPPINHPLKHHPQWFFETLLVKVKLSTSMTSLVTWWWRPQYPTLAPSNFFVNQYIKNNSNWMCERSGFRWFHWFHWCFGELLMEVWSDPPIKSKPYSSGDHAKLCKYVKGGWILQGPGIFKSDPIFRQELTYPGYLEII